MTISALALHSFDELKQLAINIVASKDDQGVYESADVVRFYEGQSDLQKPEATILEEFKKRLSEMKMLDIGVGAGRTSIHFAFLAKEYLGIDYSNKMITACLKQFPNLSSKISFLTSDARTMNRFANGTFDFILFSFNGIDYMSHKERIKTIGEIRRVLRSGGYFCFSTHNLNFQLEKSVICLSKHPSELATNIFQILRLRLLNSNEAWEAMRKSSRKRAHVMINDGAMNFRLRTYYITPVEQLKQLSELGFAKTKMYSLTSGMEFRNLDNSIDQWIYYLAQVS